MPYNPTHQKINNLFRKDGYTGKGQIFAILDTGMLSSHPALKGKIKRQIDYTGEGTEDLSGHGTVVSLIASQGLREVELLNVKVLDKNCNGFEEDLEAGMIWSAKQGADFINISAGIERDCDGSCHLCRTANTITIMYGAIICVAAGNNPSKKYCPASAEMTLSCGATDYKGEKIASYSSKGDFYLPGTILFVQKKKIL